MSIRALIEGAGLTLPACASALGVDPEIFTQWADAKREIPPAYAETLSAVLGIDQTLFTLRAADIRKVEAPAIWFKFRGKDFTDADRESILLIRRLGHNLNQLERVTEGQANRAWEVLFERVRATVNLQDSPQAQGRKAAEAFRSFTQFGRGGTGASEYLRGAIRSRGILVLESPIPKSQLEGCSFLVGELGVQRPCVFVNTYQSTWFRRNTVIMHELGHAILDQSLGVAIDKLEDDAVQRENRSKSIQEARAEAFARESLLPLGLLKSFCAQTGASLTKLTPESLAGLVAFSGVEQKTIIEILRDNELIDEALSTQYSTYEIWEILKGLTPHALSTLEYIEQIGQEAARAWTNKRSTTIGTRKITLPASFVKNVVDAVQAFRISAGRAAELLMIDKDTFISRFGDIAIEGVE